MTSYPHHFEINVSFRGTHFFATHPRSLQDRAAADVVFSQIRDRFKPEQGFSVTMTAWYEYGEQIQERLHAAGQDFTQGG